MSTIVTDITPLHRGSSLVGTFGDIDIATLPNAVRQEILAARCIRTDGLHYLELPIATCFWLPAEISQARPETRRSALGIPYPLANEPVAIPPRRTGGSFDSALID